MKKFFLLSLFTIYCLLTTSASAAITNPYTIDEKPRVLFGDSVEITATSTSGEVITYHGLENYTTNYVNNYLHITFTYTHHRCCFASYPPELYVTNIDPQGTTTITVKDSYYPYHLPSQWSSYDTQTDWHSYDIQFDVTGYNVLVLQGGATTTASLHRDIPGLTTSDWTALANRYPEVNEYSMAFTPLPLYLAPQEPEEELVATTTPVIIVPGIMGSRLVDSDNSEVWLNLSQMLLSITDSYLDVLNLSSTGGQIDGVSILPSSIIEETDGNDFFNGLFEFLNNNGFSENEDWFEYPYDWRLDIEDLVLELKEKIDEIKAERGVTNVDLVAHSMGGLVVKKYIKDYGGDSVEKFIDIGTPHNGAPKVFKILNYGDNLDASILFGLFGLNSSKIKEISQNMPSVYQLLPSRSYFTDADNDYKYYVLDLTDGNSRLTFDETSSYLKTAGRNSSLVDRADLFHQEIDNLNPSDYGVETYNIVGCGTPTIGQFYILKDGEHPIYNVKYINGDGTVPLKSAEALTASTTYYVKSAEHATMPSTSGVKELVASLLTSTTTPEISLYSNLSLTSSGCTIPNGKIVSFHSPIELHIYDSSGNHSGPDENGDIENNISGVVYEVIDDNKFAFLPDGVEYIVKGNATSEGSFDVRIQELVNGEVATTTVFADIPLSISTQAQFVVGSNIPNQIELNNDNDNTFEKTYGVSTTVAGVLETTGKPEKLITNNPQPTTNTASSKPVESTPISPVLASPELQAEAGTTSTPASTSSPQATKLISPPRPTQPAQLIPSPKPLEPIETRAVVYKSLNYKVKAVFTKLWGWFKSKL